MDALDAAMDSMYSRGVIGGESKGEESGTGNALDDFLGDLIPGGNVDSVDAYLEDIMGLDDAAEPEGTADPQGFGDGSAGSAEEEDPLASLM